MANAKEIRTKIKSIQSTRKITKAMEMVAASKKRRAQDHMDEARPYASSIHKLAAGLARASSDVTHPFLIARPKKAVGYIVVSTDRGLCGGLNINLFKMLLKDMEAEHQAGHKILASVYGSKAQKYLSGLGVPILAAKTDMGDNPQISDLIAPGKAMVDAYLAEEVDEIKLIGNSFVNTMVQRPEIEVLLPVSDELTSATQDYSWDYIYDSDPVNLFELVLLRYLQSVVKSSVSENIACEMAARMIAMKSATDNATSLIAEKQLEYNKARQAAITQELSEIVSGASAV